MKKVCVVTSNRADFGLLRWLMEDLRDSNKFALQVLATGGHFSKQQGYTWKQIEEAGFKIDSRIDELESGDVGKDAGVEMGRILSKSATELNRLKPDLLVVLGDRYEILAVVSAAVLQNIPVAHIHGGEVTEGAFDDAIRHAITQLSDLHFTAAEEYKKRVIRMGADPSKVFNVGAIGLDAIERIGLMTEEEVRQKLGITEGKPYFLITWHPETRDLENTIEHFRELLGALEAVDNLFCVFTKANNDPYGQKINSVLETRAKVKDNWLVFDSLGSKKYLSAMKYAKAVLGNSSSGIIEAPALCTPTVNVGGRQAGRLRADNILDVVARRHDIISMLDSITEDRITVLPGCLPYGSPGAGKKIVSRLR